MVAAPASDVMRMAPVVAPAGTVKVICVALTRVNVGTVTGVADRIWTVLTHSRLVPLIVTVLPVAGAVGWVKPVPVKVGAPTMVGAAEFAAVAASVVVPPAVVTCTPAAPKVRIVAGTTTVIVVLFRRVNVAPLARPPASMRLTAVVPRKLSPVTVRV